MYTQFLRHLYTVLVAGIFVTAMLMQVPKFNVTSEIKMSVFVCWAVFGILPTMHWAVQMGGFSNAMVAVSIHTRYNRGSVFTCSSVFFVCVVS